MTLSSSVKYKYSYFEHLVLTRIRGEPTYETLRHLKNELKANARSVPTTFEGGNHGYLGILLTPGEYHCIMTSNPFTWEPKPGVLIPNPSGTVTQIAIAEDTHCLTKQIYLETLVLEQTIIQKIIKSVDTKYLATLRNSVTGKITPLIPTILNFLHNNYGHITLQQLDNKTTTVK